MGNVKHDRAVRALVAAGSGALSLALLSGLAGPASAGASSGSGTGAATQQAKPVLPNGKHVAYLTGIDTGKRTLTFDVVQFLTGKAAAEAYARDFPAEAAEEGGYPPNDYYIVNRNPKLRTLKVSKSVKVMLLRNPDGTIDTTAKPGTWEKLPAYLAEQRPDDGRLSYSPFDLTVVDGTITRIAERFVP